MLFFVTNATKKLLTYSLLTLFVSAVFPKILFLFLQLSSCMDISSQMRTLIKHNSYRVRCVCASRCAPGYAGDPTIPGETCSRNDGMYNNKTVTK